MRMIDQDLGNYRVTGRVGRGGMATVYRGVHKVLGHEVAIKLLNEKYANKATVRRRFHNEAKMVAGLRHVGIVSLFDFGFDEVGHAYIVMELLDGEALSTRLRRGPIPEPTVSVLGKQIASALDHAHRRGVIHRDLKPDNIFLVADEEVPGGLRAKILDFGIAKQAWNDPAGSEATRAGALLGTPAYMSPEQCRDPSRVDHRTDIYSLGIVLYRMATGSLPFAGSTSGELIAKHQYVEPPPPRTLAAHVSIPLNDLIVGCLAKPVETRIQSMSEMSERLGEMTSEESSSEHPLAVDSEIDTSEDLTRPDSLEEGPSEELPGATTLRRMQSVDEGSKLPTTLHTSVQDGVATPSIAEHLEGRWKALLLVAGTAAVVWLIGRGLQDGSTPVEAPGRAAAQEPAPLVSSSATDARPEPPSSEPLAPADELGDAVERCRSKQSTSALDASEISPCVLAACKAGDQTLALALYRRVAAAERAGLSSACEASGLSLDAPASPTSAARQHRKKKRPPVRKRRFDSVEIPIME